MAEITAINLGKSFGITEIFSNVNFIINEFDKVGIVGPNGAGKTTLFNILTGELDDFEGKIHKSGDKKIAHMHQNVSTDSEKTIYQTMLEAFDYIHKIEKDLEDIQVQMELETDVENLHLLSDKYNKILDRYVNLGGEYFEVRIESILVGMGFEKARFEDKVKNLSGGEKSRLELAKMLISDADILLLDEPTNHLDMDTIGFVENLIKDSRKTIIFISHDRYFLDKVANRIFLLENNALSVYNTGYTKFIERRKKEIEDLKRQYENQQKEIERQEEIIKRFASLGGSLRKRGISQSRSRQKLLDKMKKLEKVETFDEKMSLKFNPSRESGYDVLSVQGISKSFDDTLLYKDVSFNIYKGDKVGLIGANGSGKTTLFKMILNKMKPDSGTVNLGVSVFPEYFDQEQENLDLDKTILDEVWDKYPSLNHFDIRSYLAKFMFIGDDIFKLVGDLSGGERSRVTLLELMLSDSNFLLMDEPTNHLDISSKEVLEEALNNYEATVFMISHDRYFLNKVCNRIIEVKDNGIEIFEGNYNYYLSKKENPNFEVEIKENKTQKKKDQKKLREEQKERQKLVRESEKIEKRIEEIEALIHDLNVEFTKPEIYEDFETTQKITKEISNLEEEKDEISMRWMEVMEIIENYEKEN